MFFKRWFSIKKNKYGFRCDRQIECKTNQYYCLFQKKRDPSVFFDKIKGFGKYLVLGINLKSYTDFVKFLLRYLSVFALSNVK
jgi:hypothetical protein